MKATGQHSQRLAQLYALKQRELARGTGTDAPLPVNREQRRAAQKGKSR